MRTDQLLHEYGLLNSILEDRRLAYFITDSTLKIEHVFDPHCLISSAGQAVVGVDLLELAPELIGSESELYHLSHNIASPLRINFLNRSSDDERNLYLCVTVKSRQQVSPDEKGVIYLAKDVTEMGKMQQGLMQSHNNLLLLQETLDNKTRELTASNREMRKLVEMNNSFVSIAAHELRTPLSIIRGYADMLLEEALGELAEPQRDGLTILRQSADRLMEIVTNLLDLARLEAGRIELVMQPLDLGALVQATAKEFRPLFEAAQQQLTVRVAPNLPAALCDETRAFQILGNLLSNASKYTARGGKIELDVRPASTGAELQIAVSDNGIGIPEAEQDRMGHLFFRASTVSQVNAYGVGMGLNITKSLVQLHGGRFWFSSREGHGSTFYVTFLVSNLLE
ncbi:MAG: HAMP domain-containing sensor histidine kinase [Caldilineales bacterium]